VNDVADWIRIEKEIPEQDRRGMVWKVTQEGIDGKMLRRILRDDENLREVFADPRLRTCLYAALNPLLPLEEIAARNGIPSFFVLFSSLSDVQDPQHMHLVQNYVR